MTVKDFKIYYGDEYPYSKDMIFKRTENGFELLDFGGNPIIKAYDIETTGEFHIFSDNNLFNNEFTTYQISEERANPSGWVRHFKIIKRELEK